MTRSRRTFTDEFKREAVRPVGQPGNTVSQVARDLGLEPSVLRRWVAQIREGNWEPTAGNIPLKFNRPTLGGQFIPGVIQWAAESDAPSSLETQCRTEGKSASIFGSRTRASGTVLRQAAVEWISGDEEPEKKAGSEDDAAVPGVDRAV